MYNIISQLPKYKYKLFFKCVQEKETNFILDKQVETIILVFSHNNLLWLKDYKNVN